MAMMYMYSGLPLSILPYLPAIPPTCVSSHQCAGQLSHLSPPTSRRDELLLSGYKYKALNCPVGILTDPLPPPSPDGDYGAFTGTDSGGGRAMKPLVVGCSSSTAGRGAAKEASLRSALQLAGDDNQLKFGIDRILGNCLPSAKNRKDKKIDAFETGDQDRTRIGVCETALGMGRSSELAGPVVSCHGWRSSRATEHSPGSARRSNRAPAGMDLRLSHKCGSVSGYCQRCYQDNSPLLHHSCDPWPYVQYPYRLDQNLQYPAKGHHPPHQVPLSSQQPHAAPNHPRLAGRRKRSWSRAVFTSLQRKGLEMRFEIQKYVNKPDRRQLAAALGLTDAQVKVWFQNRRMKWRHLQRMQKQQQQAADTSSAGAGQPPTDDCSGTDEEGPTVDRGVLPL